MSFSRTDPERISGPGLQAAGRGIGLRLGSAVPAWDSDIEATLISLLVDSLPSDFRTLGVLVSWLDVHHTAVNVPRLLRLARRSLEARGMKRARALLAAVGEWLSKRDTRFRTLGRLYEGRRTPIDDPEVTSLQIRRRGEDPRFARTSIRVADGLLRARASDVMTPLDLAQKHRGYALRRLIGANYRADVWLVLERQPGATAAEAARLAGCAYETARQVRRDFEILRAPAAGS